MIVYEGIKKDFINDVNLNLIVDKIHNRYFEVLHRHSNNSEISSWQNSMQYMRGVLDDKQIPDDAGIAIEYNIPFTSRRIDFIISGYNDVNNGSVVIVELKQWQKCEEIKDRDGLVRTYTGNAIREVAHPSFQASSYAFLINNYNQSIYDEKIGLYPCAFLHNYDIHPSDPIVSNIYKKYIDEAPLYGRNDFEKLRSFVKKYITKGDNKDNIYKIEHGKIKPSKMLQDSLSSMLKGNKEFCMIDEQKVIFENAKLAALEAKNNNKKIVHIIEGGPGTGKSVLAINLLVELTKNDLTTFYVSKNAAPRNVYSAKLKNDLSRSQIDNLFISSGHFTQSQSNEVDCLIVDESHRLNKKSGMMHNIGENQIKEIINASKYSIFFIDEDQKVTLQDIGSIDEIVKYCKEYNAEYKIDHLVGQFRCNGSDGYLAWLDDVLDIRHNANFDDFDFDYDFKIFDDPNELKKTIIEKNLNNKARLVAGYCWNWKKSEANNTNYHDIVIGDFEMSWNLYNSKTWAIDSNSINEVGCIHTCQGLEFDYVGVIIGDDLRYENDYIVSDSDKRAKTDNSLKGIKKIYEKNPKFALKIADTIIKNTYRTLMTRGMKGCYIYCTDKNLSQYFKDRLKKEINK